jgi:hypothetical protein
MVQFAGSLHGGRHIRQDKHGAIKSSIRAAQRTRGGMQCPRRTAIGNRQVEMVSQLDPLVVMQASVQRRVESIQAVWCQCIGLTQRKTPKMAYTCVGHGGRVCVPYRALPGVDGNHRISNGVKGGQCVLTRAQQLTAGLRLTFLVAAAMVALGGVLTWLGATASRRFTPRAEAQA